MSDLVRKILYFVFVAVALFGAMVLVIFTLTATTGCQSAPDKKDYVGTADECYLFSDCMYRNQKNADKSACQILAEACRDAMKEARTIKRIEYCKDKTPVGMSENECRLMLNQK